MFIIRLCFNLLSDCLDVQRAGNDSSGVYDITVGQDTVSVYCDMQTDEGGWTVSGIHLRIEC